MLAFFESIPEWFGPLGSMAAIAFVLVAVVLWWRHCTARVQLLIDKNDDAIVKLRYNAFARISKTHPGLLPEDGDDLSVAGLYELFKKGQ